MRDRSGRVVFFRLRVQRPRDSFVVVVVLVPPLLLLSSLLVFCCARSSLLTTASYIESEKEAPKPYQKAVASTDKPLTVLAWPP